MRPSRVPSLAAGRHIEGEMRKPTRVPEDTSQEGIRSLLQTRESALDREADLLAADGLDCEASLNRLLAGTIRRCRLNFESRKNLKP